MRLDDVVVVVMDANPTMIFKCLVRLSQSALAGALSLAANSIDANGCHPSASKWKFALVHFNELSGCRGAAAAIGRHEPLSAPIRRALRSDLLIIPSQVVCLSAWLSQNFAAAFFLFGGFPRPPPSMDYLRPRCARKWLDSGLLGLR